MRLSDIDLRLLRVFEAVASAGGFAKAQGTLGISQPAISTQIAKLEERLKLRLCERGPKGFALTQAGEQVLKETSTLLKNLDASAARLNALSKPQTKAVRIGLVDCMITDPKNPLIALIRRLNRDMPDIEIQIGIYDFLACLEELQADRLDISIVGIAGDERIPDEAEAMPLYIETSGLFCSPDHPCANIKDPNLLDEELLRSKISAHSFVFNPIDAELNPLLLNHSDGVAQDTIELTAYLALSGSHVGLLPVHYANNWVKKGELVTLAPDRHTIQSEFHSVRRKKANGDPLLERVWQNLGELADLVAH